MLRIFLNAKSLITSVFAFPAIFLLVTGSLLTFPDLAMAISNGNDLACTLDFGENDFAIISGIAAWGGLSLGSIVLRETTSHVPRDGFLGWLGMTTEITTTVTAPVGAIIAVGGLLVYGGSKIVTYTNCV
ncbi:hypothetical protein VB638_03720 [Dolichospermum sp. UHCC 0684]|jgi:hypothetical protein|nr:MULTISPECIES: hypothetical protein [unclassified Dolichospermum]MEA5528704.1 hypothetical protein [Dolichospermum sp. UHCC 0684]MTJ36418.1 hypothetical protein [Dolichospermum sp. UHCC 0260]